MNNEQISCDHCDNTGYIEVSGPGGCYDKECACVPFRQSITKMREEIELLHGFIDAYCGQPPFTLIYNEFDAMKSRAEVSEAKLEEIIKLPRFHNVNESYVMQASGEGLWIRMADIRAILTRGKKERK